MNLYIFSSNRALRDFYKEQICAFLPPCKTIGEFFKEIVICDGAKLPKNLRPLFLWRAIQKFRAQNSDNGANPNLSNTDLKNLGFDSSFLRFLEGSNFVFKFFDELDSANVKISDIDINDTYGDYSDHLRILEGIYNAYNAELDSHSLYDKIAHYRINEPYLRAYKQIFLYIDGVLSTKEMRILRECAEFTDISLFFTCTKYNANLLQKMLGTPIEKGFKYSFNLNSNKLTRLEKLIPQTQSINLYSFDLRISQANLVIAKVNEWLGWQNKQHESNENICKSSANQSANPHNERESSENNFAVILPDENFAKFLRLFDEKRNLNYAMGFNDNKMLKKLRDLRTKCKADNMSSKDLIDYILAHFRLENELEIRAMRDIIESLSCDEIIEFLLQNVGSIDDNSGGKVGVFGILESRAMSFEGAVIVDFNDDFIPKLNDNDMFLNSTLRNRLNLPTLRDKEDLQRHYYFMLFSSTKCVEIAYHRGTIASSMINDLRNMGARFTEIDGDKKWRFFPKERTKDFINDKIVAKNSLTKLSASAIKAFLECKRKFYFSYLCGGLRSSDEREEFLGTKIHNILRETGSEFDMRKIAPLLESSGIVERFELEIALKNLSAFFKAQQTALKNGRKILEIEARREFQINDFAFTCRVDRIDSVESPANPANPKIQIIDYKFKQHFEAKKEGFLQLLIYKIAFEREFGASCEIECLYFDLLKNKEFIMDKSAEVEAREILDSTLLELSGEVDFSKCEGANPCKYCEYKYLCDRY